MGSSGRRWEGRRPPLKIEQDEKLELAVDVERLHFVDPESGLGVDTE